MVQGWSQGDSNDVVCPLRPPHSSMQHTPSYLINWQNARLSFISYMLGRVLVTDTLSEQYIYIQNLQWELLNYLQDVEYHSLILKGKKDYLKSGLQ